MAIQIDMIGMVVGDMAAALRFYRMLGLALPEGAENDGHVEVITPNGYRLAWDTVETVRSFDPAWQPPVGGHRMALAFKCGSPAEVDATHQRLTQAGYASHRAPWDAFWGQRYATLLDPDGNPVDLFAPLAGA